MTNSFYNPPKRNVKTAQTPATNYLNFLYKYMALPDKTDYSKAFYEENVALSLQARREMPWGRTVPEREFKHFVLPVRVNNENLDDSRKVFYAELKDRVKNLSMKDAILEVNHWCHEKVTYRPTDGRTSSPLASVCTAYGRCGEESTFLVAALRSVVYLRDKYIRHVGHIPTIIMHGLKRGQMESGISLEHANQNLS